MGIENLKEKTPIILQYYGDMSVQHLGGFAVFPTEFNRALMEVEADNLLCSNLDAGRQLVNNLDSPALEKVWKLLFSALKRISNSPFSFFSLCIYKFLESYLNKIFGKFDTARSTIVYHHMNNFVFPDYKFIRIAKKFNVIMVTTIVDLLEEDFPEFLSKSTKVHRRFLKNWLSKSTSFFLPITNFIENDARNIGLIQKFSNVEVIKWGADHINKKAFSDELGKENWDTDYKNDGHDPFFLFPAKAWKHKGHEKFIKAFCANKKVNYKIVMIGDLDSLKTELNFLISNLDYDKRQYIQLLGFVDNTHKQRLFENCKAVILPSCYEGFGFPYFEAAFLRKPLVSFKTKSYLEFFGSLDTDFSVTNQDFDAFVQSLADFDIESAETEATRKYKLIQNLTWSDCVRRTLNVYAGLLKNDN